MEKFAIFNNHVGGNNQVGGNKHVGGNKQVSGNLFKKFNKKVPAKHLVHTFFLIMA